MIDAFLKAVGMRIVFLEFIETNIKQFKNNSKSFLGHESQ